MDITSLKIAIQKNGRLTKESLAFLRSLRLDFDQDSNDLIIKCKNFPLEVICLRDDDINNFVEAGVVHLGIVGENLLIEKESKAKRLFPLKFGSCSLCVAVPQSSPVTNLKQLDNLSIATSYVHSTRSYFKTRSVKIKIVNMAGSVEIAPQLGIAESVADLTSSGQTLKRSGLRIIDTIFHSKVVIICGKRSSWSKAERSLYDKFISKVKVHYE